MQEHPEASVEAPGGDSHVSAPPAKTNPIIRDRKTFCGTRLWGLSCCDHLAMNIICIMRSQVWGSIRFMSLSPCDSDCQQRSALDP